MTLGEVLSQIDLLTPNRFSVSQKIRWASEAEQIVYHQVLLTHEDLPEEFSGYDDATPMDTLLFAPPPHDLLYRWYLQAQMDLYHGETARYNNSISLFNSALLSFQDAYNRAHRPKTSATHFRV